MGPQVSVPDIDFLLSIAADDAEWVAQMPCTDWRLPAGRPCRSGRDGNSLRGRRSNRSPGTAARIRSSRSHIELGAGDASACIGCSDRAEPGLRAAVDRSTKQLRAVVSALSAGGERPVTAGMPDARPLRSPTRTGIGSGPCSLSSTLGRCQRRLAGGVSGLDGRCQPDRPVRVRGRAPGCQGRFGPGRASHDSRHVLRRRKIDRRGQPRRPRQHAPPGGTPATARRRGVGGGLLVGVLQGSGIAG
jgi:hypothetical protein